MHRKGVRHEAQKRKGQRVRGSKAQSKKSEE